MIDDAFVERFARALWERTGVEWNKFPKSTKDEVLRQYKDALMEAENARPHAE